MSYEFCIMKNFLVIGGAGEVGRGIVSAIKQSKNGYTIIDPKINKAIEELQFDELLKGIQFYKHFQYQSWTFYF